MATIYLFIRAVKQLYIYIALTQLVIFNQLSIFTDAGHPICYAKGTTSPPPQWVQWSGNYQCPPLLGTRHWADHRKSAVMAACNMLSEHCQGFGRMTNLYKSAAKEAYQPSTRSTKPWMFWLIYLALRFIILDTYHRAPGWATAVSRYRCTGTCH